MTKLRISEIFGPTIQGEGALIGKPTVFVRAGGCDYRCSWCDTLYAVDSQFRKDWTPMTTDEVWAQVQKLSNSELFVADRLVQGCWIRRCDGNTGVYCPRLVFRT